jgi:hypothetical protein
VNITDYRRDGRGHHSFVQGDPTRKQKARHKGGPNDPSNAREFCRRTQSFPKNESTRKRKMHFRQRYSIA